ncbi:MAG TPA: hypothetical protein VGI91_05250 [Steroidobacteraceae bacterium]
MSQEILWIRFAGFAYLGIPQVLGVVLCFYLAGIALGAHIGKRWCVDRKDLYQLASQVLFLSAAFDLASPWVVTASMQANQALGAAALLPVLVGTAMFKSTLFPVAHYLGSDKSGPQVGSSVSKVYFSNIAGSTLGPLLTGFVLLQVFSLQQCFELMAALTAGVGWLCSLQSRRQLTVVPIAIVLACALSLLLPMRLMTLLIGAARRDGGVVTHLVENRFGVVHTVSHPGEADTTFGGNVFDGKIAVNFANDENGIYRVFVLAALQPQTHRVLTIGLATGAWATALLEFPQIERVDAVEINPGYLRIIPDYPPVSMILSDPRMHIHIDDGRRWVRRNPGARFDLIVANTTWHWRAYSSLLLSRDFVSICRTHLLPGGIFTYNTTFSADAYETVAREFLHAYKLGTFVVGSDRELVLTEAGLLETLKAMSINGRPLIDPSDTRVTKHVHDAVASFEPYSTFRPKMVAASDREPEPITDQNLVGEYRHSDLSPLAADLSAIRLKLAELIQAKDP